MHDQPKATAGNETLLEVSGLKKHYPIKKGVFSTTVGTVKAVDGVSFSVSRGETLGIVGESGCGKSTTARLVIRLLQETEGSIRFAGKELTSLSKGELRGVRRDMQMIFQDPYASLHPRWTIERTLMEPMLVYGMGSRGEQRDRILELLNNVGLNPSYAKRYP
ncbi:ATP-binding cassette domain-containing protein, partial [Paenibacillus chitinolyticus]